MNKCLIKNCTGKGKYDHRYQKHYFTSGYCAWHYENIIIRGDMNSVNYAWVDLHKIPKNIKTTYNSIIQRCFNQNSSGFYKYGAKNISVDGSWLAPYHHGLLNFYKDMGDKPYGFSIDRIDPTKNYSKENCRWADKHLQANNKTNNSKYFRGVSKRKDRNSYDVHLQINGVVVFRKTIRNLNDAIETRLKIEKEHGIKIDY